MPHVWQAGTEQVVAGDSRNPQGERRCIMSDFITAFYTTAVRPQHGDPGGQRVGGARFAQTRVGRRSTPQQNPALQATGMCRPINFPEPHESRANIALAKRMCAACPVRQECLEWALAMPTQSDRYGVYGGLSAVERRRLRRDRANGEAA